ncbi:hypothetical protein BFJ65_g14733 [Fusarium oxysporum f. sp. cepae]|uniref:Reverse transcriptase Ty1/copia-type domain-containing protein n=1 Tax=Fusarium oxysporum f. sp. cepae TaxID=396571 RepID=A0A3L6N0E9_FUSOX|nr:hypothetical protein BFJ65_g14733 [Fusarium oxysporum f. sp. cepae]
MDNHDANDTMLDDIAKEIDGLDPVARRLRCSGHIMNLIVQAFLFRSKAKKIQEDEREGIDEASSTSIYNDFKAEIGRALPRDNDTRWNSWFRLIDVAIEKRAKFMDWIQENHAKIEKDALDHNDWNELGDIHAFLQVFHQISVRQGRENTLDEVLSHMDSLHHHFTRTKNRAFSGPRFYARFHVAWLKFEKYYQLTEQAPVYVAGILLHPALRKSYLSEQWKRNPAWVSNAVKAVRKIWSTEYKIYQLPDKQQEKGQELDEFDRWRQKVYSTASEVKDEFDRFIYGSQVGIGQQTALQWWLEPTQRENFPLLCRMAIDIFCIPPMSTEAERIFSGARRQVTWDRSSMSAKIVEASLRSGGVVKDKERAMRTGAKLPHQLWPEIGRTAVYLYNRTPNYASGWKTPYDQLHTASAKAAGIPQPKKQPDQTHLRAFGCKAYAMTSDAQQKVNRKMRLKPKGWIGFLVGYRSSNIYRIWIPTINRIVNTRDVIFNEDEGCNGDWESFKDELLEADLEEIAKFVQGSSLPEQDDNEQAEQVEDCIEVALPTTTLADESSPITDETEDCIVATALEHSLKQSEDSDILPTPPVTPLSALLAHSSRALSDEGNKTVSWQAAFLAGTKSPLQTSIERKLRQGVKMHRNSLPPPPTKHQDLKHHPFGMLFQEAEESHLQSHKEMRSWTEIRKKDARAVDQQVLGCMWVYVYKFDKHGRFQKCKARLVVRGDQQAKGRLQETYAATLAGRSFRTLIAIAARFDLEMVQYDVVNAFVNAPIDQDIFMHMAPGYKKTATILKLNKALYGLRASPLLWQKELSKTLLEIGYTQIPHEPCCFKKEGVLFFFYVDDVIIAYRKARKDKADELTRQLGSKYKLTGGDPVQWFLGMEVIRDRPARKIWLSQTAYIDKIANLANKGTSTVPMTQTELRPQTGLAAPAEIQRYQRKVGSILYIAVNTRPDIAFAASRLARFLVNPGQEHQDAADRVIHYLSHTRHRALRFGGPGGLTVASDASFSDNTLDRKSSQAYTIRLFDGLIGWRASKQNTVTTSTTEAELLALAQAAKESLYVSRLLKELTVQMDDPTIRIDCDNTQTINLVTAEIATLKTKLRHVDIHNHWLRQEVQGGRVQVKYTKSTDMIADGLTKALPAGKWNCFLYQLGLEDIQERQQQSRKQEEIEARLQKTEDCLGNAGSTGTY